jgi:hypothetical protein
MTERVAFEWAADTWYRMKFQVENRPDGTARARAKVWPADQPEPSAWTIAKTDRIPHKRGAPGLYADGISDIHFDNLKVSKNQ